MHKYFTLLVLLSQTCYGSMWEGNGTFTKNSQSELSGIEMAVTVNATFEVTAGVSTGNIVYSNTMLSKSTKTRLVDCYTPKGKGALAGSTRSQVSQTTYQEVTNTQSGTASNHPISFRIKPQPDDTYAIELDISPIITSTEISSLVKVSGGCKPVGDKFTTRKLQSKTHNLTFGGLTPNKIQYQDGVKIAAGTFSNKDGTFTYSFKLVDDPCSKIEQQLENAKVQLNTVYTMFQEKDTALAQLRHSALAAATTEFGPINADLTQRAKLNEFVASQDAFICAYANYLLTVFAPISSLTSLDPRIVQYKQAFMELNALYPQVQELNEKVKELENKLENCLKQ